MPNRLRLSPLVGPFAVELIFGGWSLAYAGLSLVTSAIPLIQPNWVNPTDPVPGRVAGCVLFLVWFVIKVIRQFWLSFISGNERIKVISGRTAEAECLYDFVIELRSYASAREGQLLTLFAEGSGTPQAIALVKVIDTAHKNVVAVPLSDIEHYFSEESRRKSLFAMTSILSDSIILSGGQS
jgi:hypothetical protein